MAYTAFIKELMHDPDMLRNLVASYIEKYKDVQQSIYNFLKLKAMQKRSTASSRKCPRKKEEHEIKQLCHEKRIVTLELDYLC